MARSSTFGGNPQPTAPFPPAESNPSAEPVFASRRARREFERATTGEIPTPEFTGSVVPAERIASAEPLRFQPAPPAAYAPPVAPAQPVAYAQPVASAPPVAPAQPTAAAQPSGLPESADPIATVVPVEHPDAPTVSAEAAEAVVRRARPVRRPPLAATKNPSAHRARRERLSQRSRVRRTWAKIGVVLAASGLLGTAALPAYAAPPVLSAQGSATAGVQTMTGRGTAAPLATRDQFSVMENPLLLDSTTGVTVSPTVQALAQKLMGAVAQGRLTGSVPNHIPEIEYLAEGRVVPNCGIDYRVLQTIDVALSVFNSVGVSDINRRCTGQIEGAGSASAHYANGGGHAVDFFLLDGQSLSGGDAQSVKLIQALDPIVPPLTNVGQSECRSSLSLTNFVSFDDTCNHLHIDFGNAQGATLKW